MATTLRRRDGKIVTVSDAEAKKLMGTGMWQPFSGTVTQTHAVSGGTGGMPTSFPPLSGSGPAQDIGSPGSFGGHDNEPAPIGAPGSFGGSDWTWEPAVTQSPAGVYTGSDGTLSTLTTEQWREVVAFQQNMLDKENRGLFWDFQWDLNTGEYIGATTLTNVPTDLMNDMESMGWAENQIQQVMDFYYRTPDAAGFGPGEAFTPEYPGGGGGGGGGGRVAPVYIAPDRRVIEDTVKAQLMTYTGEFTDQRVAELADGWLAAHRQDWEVKTSGQDGVAIDPNQVTLDTIRGQDNYKKAHALRGDGDDEARWIGDRRMRLNQLGVGGDDADERAIRMAQIGTGIGEIETGAFQNSKGRDDITLMNQLQKSAELVAGAL